MALPTPGFSLCLITRGTPRELGAIEQALRIDDASEIAVLLRAPGSSATTLRPAAERLAELAPSRGASLYVHTHTALATELGAAGVHLASDPPTGWRERIPAALRAGVSCHDARQLDAAAREGADHAFLSPFAHVPNKAPALGAARFAALARPARLPIVALGGLGPDNAAEALAAGAAAVACIRSVLDASDPAQSTRDLLAAIDAARAR